MEIKFSKPLNAVKNEMENILKNNGRFLKRQKNVLKNLSKKSLRTKCIICSYTLKDIKSFSIRKIGYKQCVNCGHIQQEYVLKFKNAAEFSEIYPCLSEKDYISRVKRIYMPKLKWITNTLKKADGFKNLKKLKWLEIGAGAGYFLKALEFEGFKNISGIDNDKILIQRMLAQKELNKNIYYSNDPADYIKKNKADIYAAFFVLEHLNKPLSVFKALETKPKNTVFAFSVPAFGFAAVLEALFDGYYARNLDGLVHTNLFTDSSIKYCLEKSGYEIISEWVFGQDAQDFSRMILTYAREKFPENIYSTTAEKINSIINDFQKIIDKNFFCDARHILAIKK